MRGARMAALLSGLTAAVALAGCGVPPSGVIEAGEPAHGPAAPSTAPSSPATVSLYFLHDGVLTAYPRRLGKARDTGGHGDTGAGGAGGADGLETVVRLLFAGPTATEATTATTQLPRLTHASRMSTGEDGVLSVHLPDATAPLSRKAVLQLACTVAQASPRTTPTKADPPTEPTATTSGIVHVLGNGWTVTPSQDACPLPPEPDD